MKKFTGYIKGINLGGWLSQCKHGKLHYDTFITKNDIAQIASWGLDHVRLPVDYELLETETGEYIESGFSYIDNCLAWCNEYGLNMILDLHKTAGYSFDEVDTSTNFFKSKKLQNRFIALWVEFSKRYHTYENRLSFELLNEIVDSTVTDIWNDIANQTIKAIRKYAPTIKILIGGINYNSISSLKSLDIPYDENIVYNFHFYDPLIFTHQSAYWVKNMPLDFSIEYPNTLKEFILRTEEFLPIGQSELLKTLSIDKVDVKFFEILFAEAVQTAEERNVALYCGEYGVIDKADLVSTLNWYSDINSAFEKYGIARAAWNYKEKDFGISDAHYLPILGELVELL